MSIRGKVNYYAYKVLSRNAYLKFSYRYYHRKRLSITNPKRFSEKLYLLKIYNGMVHDALIKRCYDKYTVRSFVKETVGEKYLTKLYGVWDNATDIDFAELPEKCVFKISQSSGCNLLCMFGYKEREEKIKEQFQTWLTEQNDPKSADIISKYEAYCHTYKSVIICEELLECENGLVPDDIRIYCFNGNAEFITIDYDSVNESGEKLHDYHRNVFNLKGQFMDVEFGRENDKTKVFPIMDNLEEMVDVAEKLAAPFEFARIDLYNVNGRVVFGEITWIPMGGAGVIKPDSFDLMLGEKLNIPHLTEIVGR